MQQCGDCILSRQHARLITQWVVQPAFEQARTHATGAVIKQGEQRWRIHARVSAQIFGDFKVAPRGRIERKVLLTAHDIQCFDVAQGLALRVLRVVQQSTERGQRAV